MPLSMSPTPLHLLLLTLAGWMNRHQQAAIDYLLEENRVLKEHLGTKRIRFTDQQRLRLALKGKALGRKALQHICTLATPDTILRWYRRLVARKYDGSKGRKAQPNPRTDAKQLALQMARENKTWGYLRIVGALQQVGIHVGRSTVARWLAEAAIDPSPTRSKRASWSAFLQAHWGTIAAADFFTVEALTWHGLDRFHVMVVIDLKTRAATIAGISRDPDARWVIQATRNLLDACDGFLLSKTHILLDRDLVFTNQVRRLLDNAGVKPVRLPPSSPNLNAYAERFLGSVRRECLDHIIPLGERHLRTVLYEYVNHHYHYERPHQSLGNTPVVAPTGAANDNGDVVRRSRLGGLLSYYYRRAA